MEILKGVFDEYDTEGELVCEYHIYLKGTTVVIPGKFRPKYMRILRQLLRGINYDNIIIGSPWL